MMPINQAYITLVLNEYLQLHNLPIRINEGGTCTGLASVFTKYVLEGKEQEFFNILNAIAERQIKKEMEDKINIFVAEVVLSFNPSTYSPELDQRRSMDTLWVNGEHPKTSFKFGVVTSDKHWESIIQKLDLQENEVMPIHSINHSIAITKRGGTYFVYDPNYTWGVQSFTTEQALIKALHDNVFNYADGPLCMHLEIFSSHKKEPARTYPNINDLYKNHIDDNCINQVAKFKKSPLTFDTLTTAARIDDVAAVNYLLEHGATPPLIAGSIDEATNILHIAIHTGHNALRTLVSKMDPKYIDDIPEEKIHNLFIYASFCGKEDSFDVLLENERFARVFNKWLADTEGNKKLISAATDGGNVKLLQKILSLRKTCIEDKKSDPTFINPDQKNSGVNLQVKENMNKAIASGNIEYIKFILGDSTVTESEPNIHINTEYLDLTFDEIEIMQYLTSAIKENKYFIVEFLLNKVPIETLKTIKIPYSILEKTDPYIFLALKDKGIKFSTLEEKLFEQKLRPTHTTRQIIEGGILQLNSYLSQLSKKTQITFSIPGHITQVAKADLDTKSTVLAQMRGLFTSGGSVTAHIQTQLRLKGEIDGLRQSSTPLLTASDCIDAFLAAHKKLGDEKIFKHSTVKESDSLVKLIDYAIKNGGSRSRTALINLGWWDQKTGKLSENAPAPVKAVVAQIIPDSEEMMHRPTS